MISDIFTILFLIFLEASLSIDNALVLAAIVGHLPKEEQKKALTYGVWGAIGFRLLALALLTYFLRSLWVKIAGAAYLLLLSAKHFFGKEDQEKGINTTKVKFWKTIAVVELTDIAFSSDSILASIGVSDKFWVIFTGGVLGILTMRMVALFFVKLMGVYPNFERTAYLLVGTIGIKMLFEGLKISQLDFSSSSNPAFIVFWAVLAICVGTGFLPEKVSSKSSLSH